MAGGGDSEHPHGLLFLLAERRLSAVVDVCSVRLSIKHDPGGSVVAGVGGGRGRG